MKAKAFKKILSIILATLFVLEILPMTVFASAVEEYNHALDVTTESTESTESPIAFEVTEQREENLKVYQRKDGSYSAFASAAPIHYRENDEWKDIDNTLVEKEVDGNTILTNKNNSYKVEFPEELTSDSAIKINNGESQISFLMRNISTSAGVVNNTVSNEESSELAQLVDVSSKDSTVTFNNIRPNIDVEYAVGAQTLKESIILNQKPTTSVSFEYELDTNGEPAVLNADSSINVYADSEIAFVIESPYMFDSADAVSENISVSLTLLDSGKYLITYTPDYAWLSGENIVYPVTIDPTTTLYRKRILNEEMYGTYTAVEGSDSTYEWFIQNYDTNYSELCLDVVSKFFETNTVITSAKLSVYCVDAGDSASNANIIAAKEITGDWGTDTSTLLTTSSEILDYNIIPVGESAKRYYWDVTEAASMWSIGQSTCKGIALVPYSTDRCNVKVNKGENTYSTRMPWLELDYITVDSSRDEFAYSTVDMGRAGTVNFNQYTGTFYLERSDLSLSGNLLPVTTGAIYDPWFRNSATTNFLGAYWNNINFLRVMRDNQYTETVTNEDGTTSTVTRTTLKLFEPDMTVKIYTSTDETDSSGRLKFEDKTGETSYTVYAASDVYTTRDFSSVTVNDGSVTRYYDTAGRAVKFVDENGNENNIYFGTSETHTISYITDGVGRKYNYSGAYIGSIYKISELEVLTSDETNIKMGNEDVSLTYGLTATDVTNTAVLTSITYPDGEQVKYEYNSDLLLTAVENIDGSRLEISYQNGRVSGFRKYVGDNILESGTDFFYESATQRVLEHYRAGSTNVSSTEVIRYNKNLEEISRITKLGEFSASNYDADGELTSDAYTKDNDESDLVKYGTFPTISTWTCVPVGAGSRKTGEPLGRRANIVNVPCYQLDSSINSTARAYQAVSGLTVGETYTFTAWGKADAVASKFFGVIVEDANKQVLSTYSFDSTVDDWQFGAASFKATTDTVTIYLAYDYQVNYAYFDGVSLYKSDKATVAETESEDSSSAEDFELEEEIPALTPASGYNAEPCSDCSCAQCATAYYDASGNWLGYYQCHCSEEDDLHSTCGCLGCRQERGKGETKDSYGNVLTSTLSDGEDILLSSVNTYSADGNYLATSTDDLGHITYYNYNADTGLLESTKTDSKKATLLEYSYNAMGALTEVSQLVSDVEMSTQYTYTKDRLSSVSHGGTKYTFEYNDFGNTTAVKLNDNTTLVSYGYDTSQRNNSVTYANGTTLSYTYGAYDNILSISVNDELAYKYTYTKKRVDSIIRLC